VPGAEHTSCGTVECVRRLSLLCVAAAVSIALQGCTSDSSPGAGQSDDALVPDATAPPPGSCDPLDQQIPPPSIIVDGHSTDATFGIGAYQCSTIAGNGYIINNFNPILIDDASKPVKIKINSDALVKLTWSLGAFTETSDNEWTSTEPTTGCDRLTISLKSPSGASRATYGADIRVGGEGVDCPQRVIDPTDVGAIVTIPLGSVPDIPIGSIPDIPIGSVVETDPTDTSDAPSPSDGAETTVKSTGTTHPSSTTAG
jgi:hypothetical protein